MDENHTDESSYDESYKAEQEKLRAANLQCYAAVGYAFDLLRRAEEAGGGKHLIPAVTSVPQNAKSETSVNLMWADYWHQCRAIMTVSYYTDTGTGAPVISGWGATWDNWRYGNPRNADCYYSHDPQQESLDQLDAFFNWLHANMQIDQITPVPKDFGQVIDVKYVETFADLVPAFVELLSEGKLAVSEQSPLGNWSSADYITYLRPVSDPDMDTNKPGTVLLRWNNDKGETLLVHSGVKEDSDWRWEWVVYATDNPQDVRLESTSFPHGRAMRVLYSMRKDRFPSMR